MISTKPLRYRSPRLALALAATLSLIGLIGVCSARDRTGSLFSLTLLLSGIGGAIGVIVQTQLEQRAFSGYLAQIDREALAESTRMHSKLSALETQVVGATVARDKAETVLTEAMARLRTAGTNLNMQADEIAKLTAQITRIQAQLDADSIDLRELVNEFTEQMRATLTEHVENNLVDLKHTVINRSQRLAQNSNDLPTHKALTKLSATISEKIEVYREIIAGLTPDHTEPMNDLHEFIGLFEQIHQESAALKVRYRNSLNTRERLKLRESVSRQRAIEQLEALATEHERFKLSEAECSQEMDDLLGTIDRQREEIARLLVQAERASIKLEPIQWSPAARDDLRMGNLIIKYFSKKQIVLDRGLAIFEGHRSRLSFHSDRNAEPVAIDDLNKHSESLQDLLNCLNQPKFRRNAETGLIDCVVQIAPEPRREFSREEIDKLWHSAAKFPELCRNWQRVRITGGSEAGKSPTAENLAVCLLKHRPGKALLYNPQHDSQKNYWTVPTVGRSHTDSAKGIKALAKLVQERSDGKTNRDEFQVWIFDEIDSTMANSDSRGEIGKAIKFTIKQASHQNLGAIYLGQNANVSEYPGISRSDWNSAVNIHIGANAFDAIANSNQFKGSVQKQLEEKASKLTEFTEQLNAKIGLEKTDPKAYRFALVVEPGKAPFFIELPEFGLYPYPQPEHNSLAQSAQIACAEPVQVADVHSAELFYSKDSHNSQDNLHKPPIGGLATVAQITCPSCGSTQVSRHSKGSAGKSRYRCLSDVNYPG